MAHEITREQINYLKRAQDIMFEVRRESDGAFSGLLTAETRKDGYIDSMIKIKTYGFICGAKSDHARQWYGAGSTCDMWQTIVGFMKPGDMLDIRFVANDYRPINCGYDDINLDVMYIKIIRGSKYYKFMLDVSMSRADAEHYNQMIIRNKYSTV